MSHPSWVCGLKLDKMCVHFAYWASHPSWVCGLKQIVNTSVLNIVCHTLRGCVD